ncbi:MAG: hypothetical protein KAS94_13380, partial [Desulfobulbaceae bacterium]|nr:hypothetical protein [Desulfobulbaceae bacterium]
APHCIDNFVGEVATHNLNGSLTRNFSAIMPAHAIRDYEDIFPLQNGEAIFVFRPDATDVA